MNISIEGEPSTSVGLPGRTTEPPPLKFLTASSSAAAMDCCGTRCVLQFFPLGQDARRIARIIACALASGASS